MTAKDLPAVRMERAPGALQAAITGAAGVPMVNRRTGAASPPLVIEVRDHHQEDHRKEVHIQRAHPDQEVPDRRAGLIKEAPDPGAVALIKAALAQNHPEALEARAAARAPGKESEINIGTFTKGESEIIVDISGNRDDIYLRVMS
jgi:hypothetical protein